MRDYTIPSALMAASLLAVAVSAFMYVDKHVPNVQVNVEFGEPDVVFSEAELDDMPGDMVMPVQRIIAHKPAVKASGCSADAVFSSRALVQGSGEVKGFCP